MTDQDEKLRIEYVPLEQAAQWDENPKKHDIGAIIQSIERYGFRDAPIWDDTLGALVGGNGRISSLRMMKQQGYKTPKGIFEKDGEWLVPIQYGINAKSKAEAKAFALDHNNIGLMGGEFTPTEIARIWDNGYVDMALGLDDVPVSLGDVDLELLKIARDGIFEYSGNGNKDPNKKGIVFRVRVNSETDELPLEVAAALKALVEEKGWTNVVIEA